MAGGWYPEDKPVAFAYEQLTISSTAVVLTAATYAPASGTQAQRAILTNETNDVRYRYDGTNPTASVGHLLKAGDPLVIEGAQNIIQFRAIRASADATLNVTYER